MKSSPSAEPPSDAEGTAAARPALALEELRLRARSMDADLTDRDALLFELSRPLEPDEDARARADVLRAIIDDPWLGGFFGSDGRRVDATAALALVELGEPYASELSPAGQAALATVRLAEPPEDSDAGQADAASPLEHASTPRARQRPGGVVLAVLLGIAELLVALNAFEEEALLGGLVLIGFGTFAPAFLPMNPRGSGLDVLRQCCLGVMALGILPWVGLTFAAMFFAGPLALLPLAIALLRLAAVINLTRPEEPS